MLRSIDLFSGVGGITLALEGVCRPVMYCDIDPVARSVLLDNMERRLIPKAPLEHDVTSIARVPKADIVIGGFPCVGFSTGGKRAGLANKASRLFYDLVDVLDRSGARAVFLENVPGVLWEMNAIVAELSVKRGFQLRWTCVSARDVGAPHLRDRWFCLGVKKGSALYKVSVRTNDRYDWKGNGPARTRNATPEVAQQAKNTHTLMGNSVVPDAVRLAFARLLSRGAVSELGTPGSVKFDRFDGGTPAKAFRCDGLYAVQAGSAKPVEIDALKPMLSRHKKLKLSFDPKALPLPLKRSPTQTNPRLLSPKSDTHWATPRHGNTRSARVLTDRTARDLPTQIRFEAGTLNREAPFTAVFMEWMMGYPLGWTSGVVASR